MTRDEKADYLDDLSALILEAGVIADKLNRVGYHFDRSSLARIESMANAELEALSV